MELFKAECGGEGVIKKFDDSDNDLPYPKWSYLVTQDERVSKGAKWSYPVTQDERVSEGANPSQRSVRDSIESCPTTETVRVPDDTSPIQDNVWDHEEELSKQGYVAEKENWDMEYPVFATKEHTAKMEDSGTT